MLRAVKVTLTNISSLQILSVLKFEKGDQMPEDYAKSFNDALAVFQHARMY
jgi:exonuclease-1